MSKHISFSQINTYRFCPFKYKLEYVDKIKKEDREKSQYLDYGSSVHVAIERFLKEKLKNTNARMVDFLNVFEESFINMFNSHHDRYKNDLSEKEFVKWIEHGKKTLIELESFLIDSFGEKYIPVESEINLKEPIKENKNLLFRGYVDSIIKDENGKLWIIDWKTTTWGWPAEKKSDKVMKYQLILYKYFLINKFDKFKDGKAKTSFVLLKRTAKDNNRCERIGVQSGDKKLKEAYDYLTNTINLIDKGVFVKNYMNCRKCPYRQSEYCNGMGL